MTTPFPNNNEYIGWNTPIRSETDVKDLVVEGKIPDEIKGSWYRMTPDPFFPPMYDEENFFAADGVASVFNFANGKVDFKNRYVMTERLIAEQAAGKALFGKYRNPYTNDPSVEGISGGVANTTPIIHAGKMFALKEDSLPMELDPYSLETKGRWDFGGKLRSETVTAHPRFDYDTGEMFLNGYEAGGLGSRDISLAVIDKAGNLTREEWFEAPYTPWMHDFVVTQEHIVFPLFPTTADLDRMKAGGHHWEWHPEMPTYIGIMPREGSVKDMRWFKGPGVSAYHFMNAYTEGNKVYLDFSYTKSHQFPFVRNDCKQPFEPEKMQCPYVRWEFDMSKPGEGWEEYVLCNAVGDFPRVANKDHMKDYEIGYYINYQPENGAPEMTGIAHMGFNSLTRLEVKSGKAKHFSLGPGTTVAEPIHVPSEKPDHEGYLIMEVSLHNEKLTDVVILEAANIEKGPIARIKLPFRLRHQVHGTWYPEDEMPKV